MVNTRFAATLRLNHLAGTSIIVAAAVLLAISMTFWHQYAGGNVGKFVPFDSDSYVYLRLADTYVNKLPISNTTFDNPSGRPVSWASIVPGITAAIQKTTRSFGLVLPTPLCGMLMVALVTMIAVASAIITAVKWGLNKQLFASMLALGVFSPAAFWMWQPSRIDHQVIAWAAFLLAGLAAGGMTTSKNTSGFIFGIMAGIAVWTGPLATIPSLILLVLAAYTPGKPASRQWLYFGAASATTIVVGYFLDQREASWVLNMAGPSPLWALAFISGSLIMCGFAASRRLLIYIGVIIGAVPASVFWVSAQNFAMLDPAVGEMLNGIQEMEPFQWSQFAGFAIGWALLVAISGPKKVLLSAVGLAGLVLAAWHARNAALLMPALATYGAVIATVNNAKYLRILTLLAIAQTVIALAASVSPVGAGSIWREARALPQNIQGGVFLGDFDATLAAAYYFNGTSIGGLFWENATLAGEALTVMSGTESAAKEFCQKHAVTHVLVNAGGPPNFAASAKWLHPVAVSGNLIAYRADYQTK